MWCCRWQRETLSPHRPSRPAPHRAGRHVACPSTIISPRSHMDADTLKALQAPLKEQYAANPASALVTLCSTSTLDAGISCKLSTGTAAKAVAGLHPMAGGAGDQLFAHPRAAHEEGTDLVVRGDFRCSGDLLLEALVACTGVVSFAEVRTRQKLITSTDSPSGLDGAGRPNRQRNDHGGGRPRFPVRTNQLHRSQTLDETTSITQRNTRCRQERASWLQGDSAQVRPRHRRRVE